jgi:UDP-N-acetyl-alpha-D-muramoyl-L-alanyl-L-glutamate epimerase
MEQHNNAIKYNKLRKRYPTFLYESFSVKQKPDGLLLGFVFKVDDYTFRPQLFFWNCNSELSLLHKPTIHSMAFHIGMIEMISYWKAFCCPEILILPFRLNLDQQEWWEKLFIHGLGEFFYTNGIILNNQKIFTFSFPDKAEVLPSICNEEQINEALTIPVGGGKDSAVTLEILKNTNPGNRTLVINQRAATKRVIEAAGYDTQKTILIDRQIDPQLLKLNDEGFLNGHTPFSALIAFTALLASYMNQMGAIVLSNESSANEPSIPGTTINHQYSKSVEFEEAFRYYSKKYIHSRVDYFSFLRPLSELQIAALFSGMNRYHKIFRSCNSGSKTDSWCGNCPKCLFTYIILSPFVPEHDIINIFGKNLLEDQSLVPLLDQLSGVAENKPLECVGTIEEVNVALMSLLNSYIIKCKPLPVLLQHYNQIPIRNNLETGSDVNKLTHLTEIGFVPKEYLSILQKHLMTLNKLQEVLVSATRL